MNMRAVLAISIALLSGCDRSQAPSEPIPGVAVSMRFQAGISVPSVGWVEAKLVRPGRDSQVKVASYATARGTFLGFEPIAAGDSFVVTMTGFDSTSSYRTARWSTFAAATARTSPIQVLDLVSIDSVPVPSRTIAPTNPYVGATFDLTGTWRYTTDGSDPRTSATALAASGSLAVQSAGRLCLAQYRPGPRGDLLWSDSACWTFDAPLDTSLYMKDQEGKVYPVVHIGSQKWMQRNLSLTTAESRCYGNDTTNCAAYGRLYPWSEARHVCPSGWHLPSRSEWLELFSFVGSAGLPTALQSTAGWPATYPTTNTTGFSAVPGGYYNANDSAFEERLYESYFWASDSTSQFSHPGVYLEQSYSLITYPMADRMSVRCLADLSAAP